MTFLYVLSLRFVKNICGFSETTEAKKEVFLATPEIETPQLNKTLNDVCETVETAVNSAENELNPSESSPDSPEREVQPTSGNNTLCRRRGGSQKKKKRKSKLYF